MPRVKRGVMAHKKREKILKYVKGFKWGRKSKERAAKEALLHAWSHAFKGRKQKKRDFRGLWQIKISAATKPLGLSYSKFIGGLKKLNIELDRKVLSDLAENNLEIFTSIVSQVKSSN
ncbi:50S ribosomal protein L20 [Candidatus Azambacteria bacterium]|nr:50S ribosomal protein L20 [Candidatus Azambacteria bacterium]